MGLAFQISRGLRANLRAKLHTDPSLGPHRQPPPGLPLPSPFTTGRCTVVPCLARRVRLGSSVEPIAESALLSPAKGRDGVRCFLPCQREEWGKIHCSLPCQGEGRGGVRGVFSSDADAPSGSGRAWCHPPAPAPRPPAHRGRCGSPPPRRCGPCRRCTRRWHPPRWWGWWRGSAP